MANTTQEKLYETFIDISRGVAISGGQPPGLDPFIGASVQLADSAGLIAKVIDSTVKTGTVAVGPEPAGQPAPASVPDPAGLTSPGPMPDPAAETVLAEAIRTVMPPADSAASASTQSAAPSPEAAPADTLPAVNDPGQNVRPPAAATNTTTSESITSTVLESVFGSMPLAGPVASAVSGTSGTSNSGGSTFESIASTVLKSGLGLVPLIGGLLGLFGGGDSTAAPPLQKYSMPASLGFEGADTGSGITASDFDQMGNPRLYGPSGAGSSGGTTSPAGASAPQITVNVQAMDARSFLDRSSDIAAAVRDAMLNSNAINDVVNEL